jgi:hypothetical protein
MTGASINAPSCFPFLARWKGGPPVRAGGPSGICWGRENRERVAIARIIGTSGGYRTYRSGLSALLPGAPKTVSAQVITADCLSLTRRCQAGWQSRKTSRGSNAQEPSLIQPSPSGGFSRAPADSLKKIRRRAQNTSSRRRPVSNRAAKSQSLSTVQCQCHKGVTRRPAGSHWRAPFTVRGPAFCLGNRLR